MTLEPVSKWLRLWLISAMLLLCGGYMKPAGADFSSYAFVLDDGTLRVAGRTVRLFGIYIPPTERSCVTFQRPLSCGPRAILALRFKVRGFVRCREKEINADGSIIALCRVNRSAFNEGEDLSAYLLARGWAVALPDAPFEYTALERIARERNLGMWGLPVEVMGRQP